METSGEEYAARTAADAAAAPAGTAAVERLTQTSTKPEVQAHLRHFAEQNELTSDETTALCAAFKRTDGAALLALTEGGRIERVRSAGLDLEVAQLLQLYVQRNSEQPATAAPAAGTIVVHVPTESAAAKSPPQATSPSAAEGKVVVASVTPPDDVATGWFASFQLRHVRLVGLLMLLLWYTGVALDLATLIEFVFVTRANFRKEFSEWEKSSGYPRLPASSFYAVLNTPQLAESYADGTTTLLENTCSVETCSAAGQACSPTEVARVGAWTPTVLMEQHAAARQRTPPPYACRSFFDYVTPAEYTARYQTALPTSSGESLLAVGGLAACSREGTTNAHVTSSSTSPSDPFTWSLAPGSVPDAPTIYRTPDALGTEIRYRYYSASSPPTDWSEPLGFRIISGSSASPTYIQWQAGFGPYEQYDKYRIAAWKPTIQPVCRPMYTALGMAPNTRNAKCYCALIAHLGDRKAADDPFLNGLDALYVFIAILAMHFLKVVVFLIFFARQATRDSPWASFFARNIFTAPMWLYFGAPFRQRYVASLNWKKDLRVGLLDAGVECAPIVWVTWQLQRLDRDVGASVDLNVLATFVIALVRLAVFVLLPLSICCQSIASARAEFERENAPAGKDIELAKPAVSA